MKKIKYEYCLFQKSIIKGIYDKAVKQTIFPFEFLKFEKPREKYLLSKGVTDVVESWKYKGKEKILHTGLIPLGNGIYIGNNIKDMGRLDFILLVNDNSKKQIHFFLINNKKPKNKKLFAYQLLKEIQKEGFVI